VNCRQQFSFCIQAKCLLVVPFLFLPGIVSAGDTVVIGGTEQQKRFLSCTAEVSANELRTAPHSDEPMTVVILEHQKFLQVRGAFHAYRTVLAFSNPATRRIISLPECSRILIRLCAALRMSWVILRPEMHLKITRNSPLGA
jgi:hypothetical protein